MNRHPDINALYAPIAEPLEAVRAAIGALWGDALALVSAEENAAPLAGGKMLRPALCLLSAGAIGVPDLQHLVHLATAFETLHIASLTHDDVIDKALLRRGSAALNALWNNHAAVLGGDYLVARAIELLAEYDSCEVIQNAIRSVRRMAEGELYFFGREKAPIVREECIQLADQKTASLFAAACSAPTYIHEPKYRQALHTYGTQLGIAFQLVDDLIDLTQPTSNLGKPACGDIAEGKRTLPILFLQERLPEADRERLAALRGAPLGEADTEWIAAQVLESGAKAETEAVAREYAAAAAKALGDLPESPCRASMEGLLEFIVNRIH